MSTPHNPLVGTWALQAVSARNGTGFGGAPWGDKPLGHLIYTEQGTMSLMISRRGRKRFASDDRRGGTNAEIKAAYDGFESFAGTYEVDAARGEVMHHVQTSIFPNWEGTDLPRTFTIDGDRMTLVTPPLPSFGMQWVITLEWKRVA